RSLSLLTLLVGSVAVLAQQPGAQPPLLDPAKNPLDDILVKWEQAMASIGSLHAQVVRTAVDKVFPAVEVFSGEAKYLKPNKASLWLVNTKKDQDVEKLVCNGQTAYKWEPLKKEIHIHTLPRTKQGPINDDNFVSMLFGMKAVEAKKRYELTLLPDP